MRVFQSWAVFTTTTGRSSRRTIRTPSVQDIATLLPSHLREHGVRPQGACPMESNSTSHPRSPESRPPREVCALVAALDGARGASMASLHQSRTCRHQSSKISKRPDDRASIAPAGYVSVVKALSRGPRRRRTRAVRSRESRSISRANDVEVTPEPPRHRDREAMLALSEDLRRKNSANGIAKKAFEPPPREPRSARVRPARALQGHGRASGPAPRASGPCSFDRPLRACPKGARPRGSLEGNARGDRAPLRSLARLALIDSKRIAIGKIGAKLTAQEGGDGRGVGERDLAPVGVDRVADAIERTFRHPFEPIAPRQRSETGRMGRDSGDGAPDEVRHRFEAPEPVRLLGTSYSRRRARLRRHRTERP